MRMVKSPLVVVLVGGVVALLFTSEETVGGELCRRVGGEEEVGGSVGGEEGGSVGGEEGGSVGGEEVGEVMGSVLSGVGDVPDELVLLGAGVVLTAGWLLKKATCGLS